MSRISSMARFRVAAALEEEHRQEQQQERPSTSGEMSTESNGSVAKGRGRLPSVAKFLAARRRSRSQSRLLDSNFFLRIVSAFDHHHHHHHHPGSASSSSSCGHSHLDDSICGRFFMRSCHRHPSGHHSPSGLLAVNGIGGGSGGAHGGGGLLNGLSSGWDLSSGEGGGCWEEGSVDPELYSSLQMDMPIKVLNGAPGYINILDGLNAWQLVSELADATGQPAAASFKHVSPAGAAIGVPLNDAEAQSLMVADLALDQRRHSLAVALARAREQSWPVETSNSCKLRQIVGADRMSSFGDFIALSQKCDELTARIISREVSDGVIAPDYDEMALSMLAKKKNGNYVVLKIDPKYLPAEDEVRTVFGLKLKQKRNTAPLSAESFADVAVGNGDEISTATVDDLLVACVAAKYAQNNAVCFVHRGQVVGMGAGQQSRLNCTRLAGEKTANWWLRQHPRVLSLPWRANVRRTEKVNIVDAIVADVRMPTLGEDGDAEPDAGAAMTRNVQPDGARVAERQWNHYFTEPVHAFSMKERRDWLSGLDGVCVASESPFHSRDSIDLAKQFGAKFIVTPSGGANDEEICVACEERAIVLIHTASSQAMR